MEHQCAYVCVLCCLVVYNEDNLTAQPFQVYPPVPSGLSVSKLISKLIKFLIFYKIKVFLNYSDNYCLHSYELKIFTFTLLYCPVLPIAPNPSQFHT